MGIGESINDAKEIILDSKAAVLNAGRDALNSLRGKRPQVSDNQPPGAPGTLPQHSPGAQPHPTAPQFVKPSTNQRVLDEWKKICNPGTGFQYFCDNYVFINNQLHGYVKFKLYPYQERTAALIAQNRFVITRKFRQAGMSLMFGVYTLWYSLTHPRMQCMIISIGQRESSKFLQESVREVLSSLPQWLKGGIGDDGKPIKWTKSRPPKDSATEIRLPNNSKIRSIPSGKAGGRSFTTKLLVIDEAAFIEGIDDIWAGIYSTVSNTGGSVFVVSTVNGVGGVGGWYYNLYKGAEAGENAFKIAEMSYTEHPDYNNENWVRETRANLGERKWKQEVLGEFLASGSTYIDHEFISKLDEQTRASPPIKKLFGDKLWVWKEFVPGHHYAIGADCATKGGLDFSTACVIDVDAGEQVAEFIGKVQEDVFAKYLADMGYLYGTAFIAPEMNAKAGGAVVNSLERVQKYKRLFRQENGDVGWLTTVRTRELLIAQLETLLYNEKVKIYSSRLVDELKTFVVTKTGKVEHDSGSHDDAIFAFLIAMTPDIQRAALRATPKQPEQVHLIEQGIEGGFVGVSTPVYSAADEAKALRKKREELIMGTEAGKIIDRFAEFNDMAGEDVLSWLINKPPPKK